MSDIKIWPVEEMVHEDEFTDRVELLRERDLWVAPFYFTMTREKRTLKEFLLG